MEPLKNDARPSQPSYMMMEVTNWMSTIWQLFTVC